MIANVKGMLTPKQKEVLDYIRRILLEKGYAPAYRDIAKEFKLKSEGSVAQYLDALEEKGYISRGGGTRHIIISDTIETQEIPLFGIIPAGSPIEPLENPIPIRVPKTMLPKTGICYALRVRGESMIDDGILDGDVVLIKHQNTAENGQIVVAVTEDGATLKRFYKEGDRVRLEPRNPKLPVIYPKEINIRGKFLGLIRGI